MRFIHSVTFTICVVALCATPAHAVLTFVESHHDGQNGVNGLLDATDVVVSPDGKHAYAVSKGDDAIARFDRDLGTGELTFVQAIEDGVGGVSGIESATAVAVSPDGAHLYVVSGASTGAVAVFARNATTGALTFVEDEVNEQNGVTGLAGGRDVALSPGGEHVYVVGFTPGAILAFSRNQTTGALTFLETEEEGVNDLDGIAGATALVVSPDGLHVYVAGNAEDSVAVFVRNVTTGRLAFREVERDGDNGVDGIDGPLGIAISDDGKHVYAGGASDDGLAVFSRNATNGRIAFVQAYHEGIDGLDGINGAAGIAVTASGQHVLVAGAAESEIGVFTRDSNTGGLTSLGAVGGIDLGGINTLRLSPDGQHLYTTAPASDAVAVFTVDSPVPTTTTSTSTTTTSFTTSSTSSSTTTTSFTTTTTSGGGTTIPTTTIPTTTIPTTSTSSTTSTTTVTAPSTTTTPSTTTMTTTSFTTTTTTNAGTTTIPTTTSTSTTSTTSTAPVETTSTSTSTSAVTTLGPTTTSPAPSTTTTTLPEEPQCETVPTFASLECRLAELQSVTGSTTALGTLRTKLDNSVGRAADRVAAAQGICSLSKTKGARQRLKRASIQLTRYVRRLRSKAAQAVPFAIREPLATEAEGIAAHAIELRNAVACPIDA